MDMNFTDEHEQLREVLHKFLSDCSSEEAVREVMETERGYDEAVWKQLAQDLGLELFAVGGSATVQTLHVWRMKDAW